MKQNVSAIGLAQGVIEIPAGIVVAHVPATLIQVTPFNAKLVMTGAAPVPKLPTMEMLVAQLIGNVWPLVAKSKLDGPKAVPNWLKPVIVAETKQEGMLVFTVKLIFLFI